MCKTPPKPLYEAAKAAFAWCRRGRCLRLSAGDSLQLDGLPAAAAAGGPDAFGLEGAADLVPAHALAAEFGYPGPHGLVVLGLALALGMDGGLPVFGGEWAGARAGCVVDHGQDSGI